VITTLLLVQLTLTLALVSNSVLLSQQAYKLSNQPTGLQLDTTLAIELKPTDENLITHPALADLVLRQLAALRQITGVRHAAFSNQTPLLLGGMNGNLYIEDEEATSNIEMVPYNFAEAELFDTLQMTLLYGRWLTAEDKNVENVVLTDKLAKKLFGDSHQALGKRTNAGTVVGVVADIMYQRYASDQYYALFFNSDMRRADYGYRLLLQTDADAIEDIRAQVADILRQVEPEIDIQNIVSLHQLQRDVFEKERGLAILLSVLSGIMLLVAMISAYSHALFHGIQQQKEIGIKRALGASKIRILLDVFIEGWLTTSIGAVLGLVASYLLQQQLAKVISLNALPLWLPLSAASLLLLCVTVATWYPATIATRVSPATATKTL
jgi:putative ABC transport system permease protein